MVTYKVTCGHGCPFEQDVTLSSPPGDWQPPTDNGDGTFTPWAGQPLLDAYDTHWESVHGPVGQPPMAEWRLQGGT